LSKRAETIKVPVITLDDYVQKTKPRKPYFLKLDTQGFDREVLKGAAGILEHCVAVLCEVSVIPIYEAQPDWKVMISELNETRV
jgi:FkbM family methyltransferase